MTPAPVLRTGRCSDSRPLAVLVLVAALAACGPEAPRDEAEPLERREDALPAGGWRTLMASGGAPIRNITRRSDGLLIGGASAGTRVDVWTSGNGGASWSLHGSVANNPAVQFGDVTMRAIPGTRTIFCAFREYAGGQYRITITRSDNDGDHWVYDSTVIGPVTRFVGAPFLFQRANGDLQVYYDSEPLAAQRGYPGHQWIAMQGRAGISGPWTAYGVVAVAWDKRAGALNREGMPTVVQLGGDRLMVVVEGVEAFATGGARANVINAVQSWDGGRTWDESLRRTVYRSRVDPGSGRRYNAYVPYAIRVGNGPVGVAFCTDEDKVGAPDLSSAPVDQRNCHVGYVSTTVNFETWSAPSPVWTATSRNYTPGLYERAPNDVIAVIDALGGNRVLQP
ncbi:phage capsid protein [Myxococcus sp. CA051A]|uniref:phage capsid protein n=1 Tax=Myxococcus sp. CA051A TaxID=2741739 RepID=UPI00157AF919|nr:phage capsid protein [Myxococcus sp. CA051A]NTX17181.1 phage capsid protein [Myxococcus sp. CA056]NTX65530.1 phage capsid protein [Myxococcus sp. CA051A]